MKTHSEQFLKKRKFLLVLPLLVLPFTTLAFWSMGGGKPAAPEVQTEQGFNTQLPGAQLKTERQDKMSLYAQAEKDTAEARTRENQNADPANTFGIDTSWSAGAYSSGPYGDPNEARLRQRLDDLERIIRQPAMDPTFAGSGNPYADYRSDNTAENQHLQRAEQMMQQLSEGPEGADPEMEQLNTMLERIMDIQHPDRYREKLKERTLAEKGTVLPVGKEPQLLEVPIVNGVASEQPATDTVRNSIYDKQGGFYDLEGPVYGDTVETRAIAAVVPETQTLVSGASLKMKLTEDIYVGGFRIPKGEYIYGQCSLEGERLSVAISGIRYGKRKFPVSLSVFGMDAMEGIRIPGAITRDATKDGADRAVQSMQLMSLDPSIGAQAAGAGIEAAKGLLSKKVKLVRVTVNAGLQVLLVDKQSER